MLNVRLALVFLILWLGTLFNVERLHEPINLASFVYVLTCCLTVFILCIPRIRRWTLIEITVISLLVYAVLKWFLGYEFGGTNLPITVTESVVIAVTNLLAFRVASGIDEFVKTAGQAAELSFVKQPLSLRDGESELYDEVQRARRFNRKLALATVSFKCSYSTELFDSLVEKAKKEIVRKFVESRIASEFTSACQSGDLVAYQNGEFVMMFPESNAGDVKLWMHEVESNLKRELGIGLQVGIACFPDQECTLTGLIERAESEMTWLTSFDFSQQDDERPAGSEITAE